MDELVIEKLSKYKQMQARIKVLSNYSVGGGITVSRLNQEDHLQELHRKLRGMPSYMYLSSYEQKLETTANTYLKNRPAGVKNQLRAIPEHGVNKEDEKLLKELRGKISKVVAARGYEIRDDLDQVLSRVAELQDLQGEIADIDSALEALEQFRPELSQLLRLRFVDGKQWEFVASELGISKATYYRYYKKAIHAYLQLTS